jgi:5'-deoxynucleotidase
MSHFFAYLSRMRFIRRWGLMHSTHTENIQEHSLRVAMIAHALAVIRNRMFGGALNAERLAVRAMYHDASEVLTGDLPRPVKYFNPEIEASYRRIEAVARARLLGMVPVPLRGDYAALLGPDPAAAADDQALLTAADKLCAYLKCLEEITAGNREFGEAEKTLRRTIEAIDRPEVRYFVETFVPSFRLTLDDLT